ncbi:MAG: fatty acid desaturase [Rhodocyclaceae bacterium]|nr:MAG: fatty acid desaturase [Rhodocyclaceae bacterium]
MSTPALHRPAPEDGKRSYRANGRLAATFLVVQFGQLLVLPLWLLPTNAAWGWLLLPSVLLTNSWWAFIHDGVHGTLFPGKAFNRLAGRVNAVLYGAPFDLLRRGHLLHHAFSRTTRERSEVYVPGRDNHLLFSLDYYFRLCGGIYYSEVAGGLAFLLPWPAIRALMRRLSKDTNLVEPIAMRILKPTTLPAVRTDVVLILACYGLAFALYGAHAWMLAAALAGRALLISLVDNLFHYGTTLDNTHYARNLALPGWASRLILHFNLHGLHHLHPDLPWWQLPRVHADGQMGYQGRWLPAMLDQFHGTIQEQRLRQPA